MNTISLRIEICCASGWIQQCGVAAWVTPSTHSMPTGKKRPQCKTLQSQKQKSVKSHLSPCEPGTLYWRLTDSALSRTITPQWSSATLHVYWGCLPWLQLLKGSGGFIIRRNQPDCSVQDCYSLAFNCLSDLLSYSDFFSLQIKIAAVIR